MTMKDHIKILDEIELSESFGSIKKLTRVEFVNAMANANQDDSDFEESIHEVHATCSY